MMIDIDELRAEIKYRIDRAERNLGAAETRPVPDLQSMTWYEGQRDGLEQILDVLCDYERGTW